MKRSYVNLYLCFIGIVSMIVYGCAGSSSTSSSTPQTSMEEAMRGLGISLEAELALKERYFSEAEDLANIALKKLDGWQMKNALGRAYYVRGASRVTLDRPQEGLSDLNKAIEYVPNKSDIHYYRSVAYEKLGDLQNSLTEAEYFHSANPQEPLGDIRTMAVKAKIIQADSQDSSITISDEMKAIVLFDEALWTMDRGSEEQALAPLSQAIDLEKLPASLIPLAYYMRAAIYNKNGSYQEAVADYQKAAQIDSSDVLIKRALAYFLATCPEASYRNGEQAVELAQQLVTKKRESSTLRILAAAWAEKGNFSKAVHFQKQAIELLGEEPEGLTSSFLKQKIIEERETYKKQLSQYEQNQPWRENPEP